MKQLNSVIAFGAILFTLHLTNLHAQDKVLRGTPQLVKHLSDEAVQKELELTEKQIVVANNAAELLSRIRDGKAQQMALESVQEVLSESQLQRLKQIYWQRLGGAAILEQDVAKTLGLSADQQKKLAVVQEKNRAEHEKMRDFMRRARFRSAAAMEAYKAKYRDAASERLLAVLTETQSKKLTDLLGEKFVR